MFFHENEFLFFFFFHVNEKEGNESKASNPTAWQSSTL